MTESEPLADLQDAVLDPETVDQLFFDIGAATEGVEVLLKGAATHHATEGPISLQQARRALQDGTVVGVQLRYRYRGSFWWDTLLTVPEGVRLVRIEHPF